MKLRTSWFFIGLFIVAATAVAQTTHVAARPFASNVVVPQSRAFASGATGAVEITAVDVGVVIVEQVATTTMDISLRNPTRGRLEAELLVPVPEGAVVRAFTFQGAASEPTAQLLTKEEARSTYERIVAKMRDPAILEFAGSDLVRSSVFPVEAHGTQKVRLSYEHLLPADGDRVDYVLPRSESLEVTVPWNVSVKIKSKTPISTVYSPSHMLDTTRGGDTSVSAKIAANAVTQPGAFRLSYLLERDGVTASLLAYPDPVNGGGYFLLLAGLPASPHRGSNALAIKREVTLVLDRSGSMQGDKLRQVREAALQIIAGLEDGEAFNIIAYNEAVEVFAARPLLKTDETEQKARAWLAGMTARGGTNIHDALLEALRQKPIEGTLPIVLFLTDGFPTIGQTSEITIRNVAMKANAHHRRVFTFGVGVDVNTPLLERIASETRATSTFVLPNEDVEVKVAQVFKRLYGPVLAGPRLELVGADGHSVPSRILDVLPGMLPDLFEGDQLVVLGRYVGEQPLSFAVSGNYLGRQRTFRFTFDLDGATTKNAFVPRLWASRKIALLIDAIRDLGADNGGRTALTDPKIKELVDEIIRLSTEFGILTEYTAFLATEGTDLAQRDEVLRQAMFNFQNRAMNTRQGLASVNQSENASFQRYQYNLNARNEYLDENMKRVAVTSVQQVNDLAFYQRGDRWIDSRVVNARSEPEPARVVRIDSNEFRALVEKLTAENRQGAVSLKGEVILSVDNEVILVTE
ncbi:MAG: VWA domain-containing protein [Verrucomicrobia bacterium]|nr:VWA domain-containing protein [Verrucomicrobiota bacterium]